MHKYIPRIADLILEDKLKTSPAVQIRGTMWCGKTTTAKEHARSVVLMDDPDEGERNRMLAESFPRDFLSKQPPLLIDEWQTVPSLWDAVRHESDRRNEFGQFILTGSVSPLEEDEENKIHHSGTGRITTMRMRPMTLYESGFSSGQVSIGSLFDNPVSFVDGESDKTIEDIAMALCRGGWPRGVGLSDEVALELPYNFLEETITSRRIKDRKGRKSVQEVERLLRSYARNISTQASRVLIAKDMGNDGSRPFDDETLVSYLKLLESLFIIEELPAWNPNIRSSAAVQSAYTRHFSDPSIAVASLGLNPDSLLSDLKTFGLMFESMCIRDLRTYAERLKGKLYHYRDSTGLEADAVMVLRDGRWAAIEVKLAGEERIKEGAAHLLKIRDRIDTDKMKAPSFLMILTAKKHAYMRKDGVYEVPISMLAP